MRGCFAVCIGSKRLFLKTIFFEQVHLFFCQVAISLDHIGNKRKNQQLRTDKKQDNGKKEIIAIGGDFKSLKIVIEKKKENQE